MRCIHESLLGLGAALVIALLAPAAAALSVGVTVALGAGNTADASSTSGSNRFQVASSAALVGAAPAPVADAAGASLSFDARYAALVAADREAGGGSTNQAATAAWTLTFDVVNPIGGLYRVDIDTSRIGALTLVSDSGGNASASLGAVVGLLDGVPDAALVLAPVGPLASAASTDFPFIQSGTTLSIVDSALARTFTLAFTWTSSASSSQDEAAIRLGLGGSLATTSADDYPGVGPRVAANDGHFARVTLTMLAVPEPTTLVLIGCGLAGLAFQGRRRASRS